MEKVRALLLLTLLYSATVSIKVEASTETSGTTITSTVAVGTTIEASTVAVGTTIETSTVASGKTTEKSVSQSQQSQGPDLNDLLSNIAQAFSDPEVQKAFSNVSVAVNKAAMTMVQDQNGANSMQLPPELTSKVGDLAKGLSREYFKSTIVDPAAASDDPSGNLQKMIDVSGGMLQKAIESYDEHQNTKEVDKAKSSSKSESGASDEAGKETTTKVEATTSAAPDNVKTTEIKTQQISETTTVSVQETTVVLSTEATTEKTTEATTEKETEVTTEEKTTEVTISETTKSEDITTTSIRPEITTKI